jgi:lipoate-protein ligase A
MIRKSPIIRFYGWSPYCISIGHHQKDDLINFPKLESDGYEFVKRPTGGRAIFHAEELTYSVLFPRDTIDHHLLYTFVHQLFAETLRRMGYPVELTNSDAKLPGLTHHPNDFLCFTKSAPTEIQFNGKKVVGSAQKILKNTIIQHGSILIGKSHAKLPDYLMIEEEVRNKLEKELENRTICLQEIKKNHITPEKIMINIVNQLELVSNISLNSLDLDEKELRSAHKYVKKIVRN